MQGFRLLPLLLSLLAPALSRRTVIITGGNRGIGLAAVRQLAATDDWTVVLASRDMQRARAAMASLPLQSQTNVELELLDLADLQSVVDFSSRWKQQGRDLHVLACNAGVQHSGSKDSPIRTKDGFEDTIGTNHIGHFLLTSLLMKSIADDGRIVFVGSGTAIIV